MRRHLEMSLVSVHALLRSGYLWGLSLLYGLQLVYSVYLYVRDAWKRRGNAIVVLVNLGCGNRRWISGGMGCAMHTVYLDICILGLSGVYRGGLGMRVFVNCKVKSDEIEDMAGRESYNR